MPEEIKNSDGKETQVWRGIKQDPKGGFIVYITETTNRAFDTIDDAVSYMTKAGLDKAIKVEAGSPEFSGVQRGQDNIDGVKQVTIVRKLVEDKQSGKWKVKEKTRTDILKDDEESAKSAYKNIEDAKEEAEYVENPFEEIDEEKEVSKESSLRPLGTCAKCGASIYPPGITSEDMAPWFDRHIPADLLCPACGYGIGEPTNFIYSNEKLNEESVEKFSSLSAEAAATSFSVPVRSIDFEIDTEFLKKIVEEKKLPYNDSVIDIKYEVPYGDLVWSFDTILDSWGVETFRIEIPDQTISIQVSYEYETESGDMDDVFEFIDVPLSNIDFTASSIDLESSSLFPSKMEIYPDGTSLVSF